VDKAEVLSVINQFRIEMEMRGFSVKRIILFGSYARNDAHCGSDIDLVIISDDFDGLDFWQRIAIAGDIIYKLMKPIEANMISSQEWESGEWTISELAKNGETVFAA